jgi:hypothetical protein
LLRNIRHLLKEKGTKKNFKKKLPGRTIWWRRPSREPSFVQSDQPLTAWVDTTQLQHKN